jgi:hypothetical protein
VWHLLQYFSWESAFISRTNVWHRGHSPGIEFPRILGIEAVGEVADAPGGEFEKGAIVATCSMQYFPLSYVVNSEQV